jgi:hypothetical protein
MLQHLYFNWQPHPFCSLRTPARSLRHRQRQTPTTKILAIGTFAPGTDMQLVQRTLAAEVCATAELYLEGKIDQWYSLENRPGRGVHAECHRHRCGTGHVGIATPGQRTPDDLRTLSGWAVEPAAPVIEIARGPLALGYMASAE